LLGTLGCLSIILMKPILKLLFGSFHVQLIQWLVRWGYF